MVTKILEKTFHFQYRSQLQQESASIRAALAAGKNITDPDFPRWSPYQMASLQERLIDGFFIGTFFEIAAKSFLLDRGFVVHKLKRDSRNPDIERMARYQSSVPSLTLF